jgi:hypothetical protein
MKFEIIGDISNLEVLMILKYSLSNSEINSEIIRLTKLSETILIEYKEKKCGERRGELIPQSFIREFKIQIILDNIVDIDNEIIITTELIKKKLINN